MDKEEKMGIEIARNNLVIPQKSGEWTIASLNQEDYKIEVSKDSNGQFHCNCSFFTSTGKTCRHIYAVRYTINLIQLREGDPLKKPGAVKTNKSRYKQNWSPYNEAQNNADVVFPWILSDLLFGLKTKQNETGRPPIKLNEALFCTLRKVCLNKTIRGVKCQYASDLKDKYIEHTPHPNITSKILNREDITPHIDHILAKTSRPFVGRARIFAIDSSGFSTSIIEDKKGNDQDKDNKQTSIIKNGIHNSQDENSKKTSKNEEKKEIDQNKDDKKRHHKSIKGHIMVDVDTHIITAATVTNSNIPDSKEFEKLVNITKKNGFTIERILADKGYYSEDICQFAENNNIEYYTHPKSNANPDPGTLLNRMVDKYLLHIEEYLDNYHQRSNVEATFHMIKCFGEQLRSKNDIAQKNEVLCKLIGHNIHVLIHEMYQSLSYRYQELDLSKFIPGITSQRYNPITPNVSCQPVYDLISENRFPRFRD